MMQYRSPTKGRSDKMRTYWALVNVKGWERGEGNGKRWWKWRDRKDRRRISK
jgi:hypothetical protein